jgi:hypothetical protein
MKTNLLRCVRSHRSEYHAGKWFAGRIHIYTPTRALIRLLRAKIQNRHQRFGPACKATRIALYAGAMQTHRAERLLCRQFRL